jgi:hypothetical protein
MSEILRIPAAPLGLCADCRAELDRGASVRYRETLHGVRVRWWYCIHNEAGAHLVERLPGYAPRWHQVNPIDVIAFEQHVGEVVAQIVRLQLAGGTPPPAD